MENSAEENSEELLKHQPPEVRAFLKRIDEFCNKQVFDRDYLASSGLSLWDHAAAAMEEGKGQNIKLKNKMPSFQDFTTIFFLGNEFAGKTSIIYSFLEKDDEPQRTLALDFNFARRINRDTTREVCHIWELGGDASEVSDLIEIPILHCPSLTKMTLFIILDLSQPKQVWNTFESILTNAQRAFKEALKQMDKSSGVKLTEALENKYEQMFTKLADPEDKNFLEPFPITLAIIGTKYDLFQELDTETRKVIYRVLRIVANKYGASLNFHSKNDISLSRRLKEIISHYAFQTPFPKGLDTDINNPLMIAPGSDSFEKISSGTSPSQFTLEYCRHLIHSKIGAPEKVTSKKLETDPTSDPKFAEPEIDKRRLEMLNELGRTMEILNTGERETNKSQII